MMSLQPLELRDHHLAGWDQRATILVGKGARPESLGEARIGSSFLVPIARSSDDHAVNYLAGIFDAICWDAAAMSVAKEEAGSLCKPSRVCGFGAASPQQQEQDGCDR
jgi:hypothetical protein